MKSIECLSDYEKILMTNSTSEQMFDDFLGWIRARRSDWQDDRIRIGLVGDTSSGKSTLINAILGYDILSSSVVPSSGVLVCCTNGPEQKIIIHFVDGRDEILKGNDFTKEKLQEYSDERYNSGNHKGVSSIELQSPCLDLGNDIILIDSPGLNAFGLESHERITLDTLIPTIDVCIYVTTVKVNSDSNTLVVLNTVAMYNCPIIIVQNKIDSINASPSGDKDRNQVAKDHFDRLKRIVNCSDIQDKSSVQIVQMSAINALKRKISHSINDDIFVESGFERFVGILKTQLNDYRPYIESVRLKSISASMCAITTEIANSLNMVEIIETPIESTDYDAQIQEIEDFIVETSEEVEKTTERICKDMNTFLSQSVKLLSGKNAQKYYGMANSIMDSSNKSVSAYIQKTYDSIVKFSQYANIPNRDILAASPVRDSRKIDVPTYEKTTREKRKRPGFGWMFVRVAGFVSDHNEWGYDYVEETRQEVDLPKARERIVNGIEKEKSWCTRVLLDRKETVISAVSDIKDQLISRRESRIKRRNAQIKRETLVNILSDLNTLIDQIGIDSVIPAGITVENFHYSEQIKSIEIDNVTKNVLVLGNEIKKLQQINTMKELVRIEHLDNYVPILLGWDETCNNDFNWNAGIADMRVIHLLKEDAPKEKDGVDTCFFVLVNASQIGMEKKKITNLKLANIVEPNDYVVWVVQDFDELLNSDSVDEGLRNMVWLKDFCGVHSKSIIWISNNNPIYNIAFLYWQFHSDKSFSNQQLFLDDFKKRFLTYCDEETMGVIAKHILKVRV